MCGDAPKSVTPTSDEPSVTDRIQRCQEGSLGTGSDGQIEAHSDGERNTHTNTNTHSLIKRRHLFPPLGSPLEHGSQKRRGKRFSQS